MPSRVEFREDRCKGCLLCTEACPTDRIHRLQPYISPRPHNFTCKSVCKLLQGMLPFRPVVFRIKYNSYILIILFTFICHKAC